MTTLDLSDYRAQVLELAGELLAVESTRVRFAYRGRRLAPCAGVPRAWLIDELPAPHSTDDMNLLAPPPKSFEGTDDGGSGPSTATATIDIVMPERDDAEVAASPGAEPEPEPRPEPELGPTVSALLDALGAQMRFLDILANRDFRLEQLGSADARWLEDVRAALPALRTRLHEVASAAAAPADVVAMLNRLARELESLETFAVGTLSNVAIGLSTDAAGTSASEPALSLPTPSRDERVRPDERGRAAGGAAAEVAGETYKIGRARVRISARELRIVQAIAVVVMPLLIVGAVAYFEWWKPRTGASAPSNPDSALARLKTQAEGDALVVDLASWTSFEEQRGLLVELATEASNRKYRSARFRHAGKVVAVWQDGYVKPTP